MTRTPDDILDELLVLRCQDGDARAFEVLVTRWQQPLRRHAWRLTGCTDAASDVVQEAWLAIVRGLRRLDDPARFRPWALRIVTNKCADWTRRQQRQRRIMRSVATETSSTTGAAGAPSFAPRSVGEEPVADETDGTEISRLREALRELPRDRRAILSMLYLDGLSTRQIAQSLSLPVGTVKSRLHHARNQLRNLLERKRP